MVSLAGLELRAEHCVLAFLVLIVAHVVIILASRTVAIMSGTKKPGDFYPSRKVVEVDTFIGRVSASHANCLENFTLFAAVVLTNKAFGAADLDFLAVWYFAARCLQVSFHFLGVSDQLITLRFYAFAPQLGLLLTMALHTGLSL